MKKNLTAMTLAGVIVASNIMPVCADSKFNDVNNHWAKQSIETFISKGNINGYQDGTFKPDSAITRAEFVKLVNKHFNFTESFIEEFTDINERDWYYYDFCIALNAGYMKGYSDGSMKPNKYITREEVASILSSIKNIKDSDYDKIYKYIDNKKISNWAKSSVEGALEAGYLKGNDRGELQPKKNITRAEAVVSLSRIETNKPTTDNNKPNTENTNKPNVDNNKPSTGKVYSSVNDAEFKEIVNQEMFRLVNDHRRANGVSPLERDSRLDRMANNWSKYMNDKDFFSHRDPATNERVTSIFPESGVSATGENIGISRLHVEDKGYSINLKDFHNNIDKDLAKAIAESRFNGWKKSAGHNANMLDADYTKFGFGFDGKMDSIDVIAISATQEFIF